MKKTLAVRVDEEVHRRLRMDVAAKGTDMRTVVVGLIKQYLGMHSEKSSVARPN